MKRTLVLIAVSALAAGCASAPADAPMGADPAMEAATVAPRLDPVGHYTLSTSVQGRAVDGRIRITGARGSWGGSIYTQVTGELPLSSVAVDGQEVRLTANTPDGTVHIRMLVSGDTFTGDWSLGAEGGSLRGRRVER